MQATLLSQPKRLSRTLKRWDLASGQEVWSAELSKGVITAVAFSADGKRAFAAVGHDHRGSRMTLTLWDTNQGKRLQDLTRADDK